MLTPLRNDNSPKRRELCMVAYEETLKRVTSFNPCPGQHSYRQNITKEQTLTQLQLCIVIQPRLTRNHRPEQNPKTHTFSSLSHSLSISLPHSPSLSLSLTLSPSLSLSLPLSHSLSLSFPLSPSLSIALSLSLPLFPSLSLSLHRSLSLSLSLSLDLRSIKERWKGIL